MGHEPKVRPTAPPHNPAPWGVVRPGRPPRWKTTASGVTREGGFFAGQRSRRPRLTR